MIYRNLNPTIKLLDNEMNPKISGFGFGLAKIIEDDHTQVSTRIIETTYYHDICILSEPRITIFCFFDLCVQRLFLTSILYQRSSFRNVRCLQFWCIGLGDIEWQEI